MRLQPIEKPNSVITRIAYYLTRRRLGKVITPIKTVNARVPASLRVMQELARFVEKGVSIDAELSFLIRVYGASVNKCSFCIDIAQAIALKGGIPMDKFNALPEYRTAAVFSERERAALAYVEEIMQHKTVSDETFDTLRAYFNDTEIAEITLLNAVESFYNAVNLPLEIESDGLCALVKPR